MGDDLSDEAKIEIMWDERRARMANPQLAQPASPPSRPSLFPKSVNEVVIWILICAAAFGQGPDVLGKLLTVMGVK